MRLGKVNISRSDKVKAEIRFPISEEYYTVGKLLLDGTVSDTLNTRATLRKC